MIRNTAKNPTFFDAMFVEVGESVGQGELVRSELLPSDMQGRREAFEKMGFKFGEPVDGDPMFLKAALPEGWKKQRTDHAMWSKIVDENGRDRAKVFYKAAFYDRRAHMYLSERYKIEGPYGDETYNTGKPCEARVIDLKTGEVLHRLTRDKGPEEWQSADWNAAEAAGEWLKQNRPNHRDPLAWLED